MPEFLEGFLDSMPLLNAQTGHRFAPAEPRHKTRKVCFAIPEGRHPQGEHVEAVVQILSKLSVPNHFLQIPVGRRDDSYVDPYGAASTQSVHFRFLENTKELCLHIVGKFTDLSEKECSPIGLLEFPDSFENRLH